MTTDIVRQYLDDIGRHPLLTWDDEVRLGALVLAGQEAQAELDSDTPPNPRRIRELRRQVRNGEHAAVEFVNANLRLVVSVARRYQHTGYPLLDLIQEGNFGLMTAVRKFDYRKGFKFSTYATWWIRQAIQRGVLTGNPTIRVPQHMHDLRVQYDQTVIRLETDLLRAPTVAEIAAEMRVPVSRVEELLEISRVAVSLDEVVGESEDTNMGEFLTEADIDVAGDALRSIITAGLHEALAGLPKRERDLLIHRYGLDGGRGATYDELGRLFGVTRERCRQIEKAAVARIRSSRALVDLMTEPSSA